MGIGRDSANFFKRGLIGLIKIVAVFGLFIMIGYFGYKFISANYAASPNYATIVFGFFVGDLIFCAIVERFIDRVLLKE
jgi:uncharacterized membrane protein